MKNKNILISFLKKTYYNVRNYFKFLDLTTRELNKYLIDSCGEGDLLTVKYLVTKGADIQYAFNAPLRNASLYNRLEVVKFLIDENAHVSALNDFSLRYASLYGHLEVVKFLVENGANIHSQNDESLVWAWMNDKIEIIKFLIEKGANINLCPEEHKAIILKIINERRLETENVLLSKTNMYKDVISIVNEYVFIN